MLRALATALFACKQAPTVLVGMGLVCSCRSCLGSESALFNDMGLSGETHQTLDFALEDLDITESDHAVGGW